ncbi:tetratricopeptide repeat protein [Prauserella sp. ASG 168]|uniref:Tetratricopeptide repeat protein n=1 Tax=Prauserella cavernicola TaxID=2800127 RepID=A0A934QQW8_9PSEU|nr:tetratricopeptide repeat protein [Prauserella cavernicola]
MQRGSSSTTSTPRGGESDVPRQLKTPPARFTNREQELASLQARLDTSTGRPLVQVISGPGGIGKTALALRWLGGIAERYPGGALQASLGAFDPTGPVPVGEVLGQFLRALGVPGSRVPVDVDEQGGLFRTLTAAAPMLVLLDNADSEAQVRPLIPAAADSLVVVTSRRPLGGLAVDEGARLLTLEPLTAEHSMTLLRDTLGADRVDTERAHATTIVRLTAGLPIALCSVAGRLAAKPKATLERTASDLSVGRRRLAVLSAGKEGDSVQASFDLAYQALPPEAARTYRLLGQHPGAEFGVGVAAAAVNGPAATTRRLLDELVEVNMLTEPEDGRYAFHDLHRLHAVEKAEEHETGDDRRDAQLRILEWYLRGARSTAHLVTLDQEPIPYEYVHRRPDGSSLPSEDEALDWLERERTNLFAAMQAAAQIGMPALGWQLGDAMWPLFLLRKHYRDFLTVSQLGVDCAKRWGNRAAEVIMRNRCGAACRGAGRFDEAVEHYTAALRALPADGDQVAAIRSVEGLGLVALAQGRLDDALREFDDDLHRSQQLERAHDIALAQVNLGVTLTRLGRAGEAIEKLEQALGLLTGQHDSYNVARARIDLARALALEGRTAEATEHVTEAREAMRQSGSAFEEARAMQVLAEVAESAGRADEAKERYEAVLPIFTELGRPEASEVRERLRQVQNPS